MNIWFLAEYTNIPNQYFHIYEYTVFVLQVFAFVIEFFKKTQGKFFSGNFVYMNIQNNMNVYYYVYIYVS